MGEKKRWEWVGMGGLRLEIFGGGGSSVHVV
jgi:hypothetical protein